MWAWLSALTKPVTLMKLNFLNCHFENFLLCQRYAITCWAWMEHENIEIKGLKKKLDCIETVFGQCYVYELHAMQKAMCWSFKNYERMFEEISSWWWWWRNQFNILLGSRFIEIFVFGMYMWTHQGLLSIFVESKVRKGKASWKTSARYIARQGKGKRKQALE